MPFRNRKKKALTRKGKYTIQNPPKRGMKSGMEVLYDKFLFQVLDLQKK